MAMTLVPTSSLAWSTPTYTDVWSEPTYTDIWSNPVYTDIWSNPIYTDIWTEPIYTDIWSEEDIVYRELEEGSVRVSVTPSSNDYYFALLRSVDFNDFEYYKLLTEPYYVDNDAKANHTYIYVFATFDKYENYTGISNPVVIKVLPKPKPVPTPTSPNMIELQINNRVATIDGKKQSLNVAPFVQNDRTLVPIRFVSEAMGGNRRLE